MAICQALTEAHDDFQSYFDESRPSGRLSCLLATTNSQQGILTPYLCWYVRPLRPWSDHGIGVSSPPDDRFEQDLGLFHHQEHGQEVSLPYGYGDTVTVTMAHRYDAVCPGRVKWPQSQTRMPQGRSTALSAAPLKGPPALTTRRRLSGPGRYSVGAWLHT